METFNLERYKQRILDLSSFGSVAVTHMRAETSTTGTSPVEIEVRFTEYSEARGVTIRTFNRLKDIYNFLPMVNTITTDYTYTEGRKTISQGKETWILKKSLWGDLKQGVQDQHNREYKLKFDVNTETKLNPPTPAAGSVPVIRQKNRYSYNFSDKYRLDLTVATMTDEKKKETLTYEVELELHDISYIDNWIDQIKTLLLQIQNTKLVYPFSEYKSILSHVSTRLSGVSVEAKLPNLLPQAKNLGFHHLTYGQIVGGDIVYNVTAKTDGVRKMLVYHNNSFYFVMSPGEINKIFVFFTDPFGGRLDNLITDGELIPKDKRKPAVLSTKYLGGTDIRVQVENEYYYVIFDLISLDVEIPDVSDIRQIIHKRRMKQAVKSVDLITKLDNDKLREILLITTKEFYELDSTEGFFLSMNSVNDMIQAVSYETDGFIFMPESGDNILKWKPLERLTMDLSIRIIRAPSDPNGVIVKGFAYTRDKEILSYDPTTQVFVKSEGLNVGIESIEYKEVRKTLYIPNIIHYPSYIDTLTGGNKNYLFTRDKVAGKYKLSEGKFDADSEQYIVKAIKSNINFVAKVKYLVKSNFIIMSIFSSGGYVLFDKPIEPMMETKKGIVDLRGLEATTIVEFRWDGSKLIPMLIRSDKPYPNDIRVVADIWRNIEDPIELSTLLGTDIRLMRKYHNRIKRNLLANRSGLLLDLGSGIGGDVNKWDNFEKIICVEPSDSNIIILKQRIKSKYNLDATVLTNVGRNIKVKDKIVILKTGAEDHQFITQMVNIFFGRQADVVSSMLSLSFFWFNDSLLDNLVTTITTNLKKGGVYLYLTIDGNSVEQYFNPPLRGPILTELTLLNSQIQIRYNQAESTLFIDLPTSETVKEQTESLVYLDALRSRITSFEELYYYRADQELLLNKSERLLSGLYSYGVFKK